MRYFMLDRITEFKAGSHAAGVKNVTLTDEVLHDHFPDLPILPGAFVIEAMAQLGGFLLEMSLNKPGAVRRAILVQVDVAKFHKPAEPGDQLVLSARFAEALDDAAKVEATVSIAGQKTASAKLTFYLKSIESERIHDQRKRLYTIWTKHLDQKPEIL